MLKDSYASYLGLSLGVSAQFTLKMCIAHRDREQCTKIPYVGGSKSLKVINVDNS